MFLELDEVVYHMGKSTNSVAACCVTHQASYPRSHGKTDSLIKMPTSHDLINGYKIEKQGRR